MNAADRAAIRKRDAEWADASFDEDGRLHEHPETECPADRDRHVLLAALTEAESVLDVERLAQALNASVGTNGWLRAAPSRPVEEWRVNARIIAAEYKRLGGHD